MLPYLARRIANYAVLLFIATSLAYLLASASLDPSALWNRQDPSLNWDAIHANLVKYNISHDLPVWDRYVTWLRNVLFHWDWGRTPKGELINTLIGTKIFVSVRLVFLGAAIGMVGGVALGAWTATRQYRFSDRVTSLISMIIISTPAMVIAILLQVLAVQINRSSGFQIFEFTGEGEGEAEAVTARGVFSSWSRLWPYQRCVGRWPERPLRPMTPCFTVCEAASPRTSDREQDREHQAR